LVGLQVSYSLREGGILPAFVYCCTMANPSVAAPSLESEPSLPPCFLPGLEPLPNGVADVLLDAALEETRSWSGEFKARDGLTEEVIVKQLINSYA
jgi:hypothetical protein